jgi:hypothetical protein
VNNRRATWPGGSQENKTIGKESLVISKKSVAFAAIIGVALSGLALAPAHAEPVSNGYSIVGSDTLEDVVNAIVNGSNLSGASVRLTTGGSTLGSFDATGSSTIITKPNGVRFGRPNGSGDGVKALSRSMDGASYTSGTSGSPTTTISGQVDIARSSSSGTSNSNGELVYIPFGRDAIAYAYGATDGTTASATNIDSLTLANLASLYTCGGSTTAPSQQFGGQTVTAVLPQAGSGTRKDFLLKLGLLDSNKAELASVGAAITSGCVKIGQEHDASTLATNEVMPMSASRWIAMANGASVLKKSTVATITGVSSANGTVVPAVDGTGSALSPNAAYYAGSTWGRDTYVVVEFARIDSTNVLFDANLANAVSTTNTKSLTYNGTNALNSTSLALKKKFGFLAPSGSAVNIRVAKSA